MAKFTPLTGNNYVIIDPCHLLLYLKNQLIKPYAKQPKAAHNLNLYLAAS